MNTQDVTRMAAMAAAPKMLSRGKIKWLVLAAGAYYGLKYLSSKGVLPATADSALKKVDSVIVDAKENFGFHS